MQSSDAATGVLVNCLYNIVSQKWNAMNKQTSFAFNFGEDLTPKLFCDSSIQIT